MSEGEEITSWVNEVVPEPEIDDIDDFIKHYGYEKSFIMDFVDLDEVTDIVVNSDGYGNLLNSYDGEMFETQVNGDWYFVMRAS